MNDYKRILKALADNKRLVGIDLPKGKPLANMPNNRLLVQSSRFVEFTDLLESREISLATGSTIVKLSKSLATSFLAKLNSKRKLRVSETMLCIVDGYINNVNGVKHLANKLVLVDKQMLEDNRYTTLADVQYSGVPLTPKELILNNSDTFNLMEVQATPLRINTNRDDVYLQVDEVSKQPRYKVTVRMLDPKTNKFKIHTVHIVTPVFRDTTELRCSDLINHIKKLELREAEGETYLINFRKYIEVKKFSQSKEFYEKLLELTPYKFLKWSAYSPEVNAAYIYAHIGQEVATLHSLFIRNQLVKQQLFDILPSITVSCKTK